MMLMIILILVVFGLIAGSFINALVWRVHQQDKTTKTYKKSKTTSDLSIIKGRSMCPNCKHDLATKDLIPVLSWVFLRGKCRYCHKPISAQYPIVELATALLFVVSYIFWPFELSGGQSVAFVLWLLILTGLIALLVYDLLWMLLPNRIMFPLFILAAVYAGMQVIMSDNRIAAVINLIFAVLIGGGIFYLLFQISNGKWIGGGDVKLGWLLGLIIGTASASFLMIFIASVLGSIVSISLIGSKKLNLKSTIPFGPFLIISAIIVQLFGSKILDWYQSIFFLY